MARRRRRRALSLEDPSDGSVLAPIARGGSADIDAAVAAARAALDSARRLGAASPPSSAAASSPPSAARCSRTSSCWRGSRRTTSASRSSRRAPTSGAGALLRILRRRRRQGSRRHHPFRRRLHGATLHEPHGVTGHIFPGTIRCRSSAAASARRSPWATPASEAGRGGLPDGARLRPHRGGSGLAARRAQRRPGLGEEAGAALSATRHQPHLLHRLGRRPARWCRRAARGTRCR